MNGTWCWCMKQYGGQCGCPNFELLTIYHCVRLFFVQLICLLRMKIEWMETMGEPTVALLDKEKNV